MGMDWHSSGITTSVLGALKRGLGPLSGELGIHVCGGRGRHSRETPNELMTVGDRVVFAYFFPCGRCRACLRGREWTCPNRDECGYCATWSGAARFAIPVSRSE